MTGLDLPLGLEPGQSFADAMRAIVADLLGRQTQIGHFAAHYLSEAIDEIEAFSAESPLDLEYRVAEANGRLTHVINHSEEGRWLVYPKGSTDPIGEVWTYAAATRTPAAQGWFVYRWSAADWGGYHVGADKTLTEALVMAGHVTRPGEVYHAC